VSLAARLWAASADLAAVALDHPFVQGLRSGTLPRQAFSSYVAQDALFLDCFARAYALALVRAPDRETLEVFADLITGVRNELRLHASYAREWGADRPTAPLPATSAYTDFLLATAALGGVGQVCAVMTPCMRLYAHLGSRLSAIGHRDRRPVWRVGPHLRRPGLRESRHVPGAPARPARHRRHGDCRHLSACHGARAGVLRRGA